MKKYTGDKLSKYYDKYVNKLASLTPKRLAYLMRIKKEFGLANLSADEVANAKTLTDEDKVNYFRRDLSIINYRYITKRNNQFRENYQKALSQLGVPNEITSKVGLALQKEQVRHKIASLAAKLPSIWQYYKMKEVKEKGDMTEEEEAEETEELINEINLALKSVE